MKEHATATCTSVPSKYKFKPEQFPYKESEWKFTISAVCDAIKCTCITHTLFLTTELSHPWHERLLSKKQVAWECNLHFDSTVVTLCFASFGSSYALDAFTPIYNGTFNSWLSFQNRNNVNLSTNDIAQSPNNQPHTQACPSFSMLPAEKRRSGSQIRDIHAWVAMRFELYDLICENHRLISSLSASQLSEGRLLDKR